MTIQYKVNCVKGMKQIEIEDTKNVFLKGTDFYYEHPTYFGVWNNKNTLVIVTIINWQTIKYKRLLNIDLSTDNDIIEYLKNNNNVTNITKAEFKEQMKYVQEVLEIE